MPLQFQMSQSDFAVCMYVLFGSRALFCFGAGNAFSNAQILFNQYANYFNWNSNQNALHSVPFRSHRRYRSVLESCCTTQYL